MSEQATMTTGEAARCLNVSPNTLRIWQFRYGVPSSVRTAGGHRRWVLDEVETLARIMRDGMRVSSALAMLASRREVYVVCPQCGGRIDHVYVRGLA